MGEGIKRRIVFILISFCITVCLLSRCATFYTSHNSVFGPVKSPQNVWCELSFNDFAFTVPNFYQRNYSGFPVKAPWGKIDTLPNSPSVHTKNQIVGISYFNNTRQIWIAEKPFHFKLINKVILSYDIDTGEWKTFSNEISPSNFAIHDLVISETGDVFALTINPEASYYSKNVSLSKYDEAKQAFVALANSDLPIRNLNKYNDTYLLPEKDGSIWIVRESDAIYRYDLASETLHEVIGIAEHGIITQAIWAPSNQILLYFPTWANGFTGTELVLFDIDRMALSEIGFQIKDIRQAWLFYDSNDNLWIGAFGKLGENNKWHQFLPFPGILRRAGGDNHYISFYFTPPKAIYESSDEKLWFSMDTLYDSPTFRTGMAWYDRNTKEGCWFAGGNTSIIEDDEGYMWLLANGALYRANLSDIDGRP